MSTVEGLMKDPLSISDEDLARMIESEQGEEDAAPGVETKEEPDEPKGEQEPEASILTRDGKHQIPYSVLEKERNRATEAEQARRQAEEMAEQRAAQIQLLQEQLQQRVQDRDDPPAEVQGVSAEDLAAIKEEAPALGKIIEDQTAQIAALMKTLREEQASRKTFEDGVKARFQNEGRNVVEVAISNNAKLVYLRAEDPQAYNEVVEMDNFIRGQAKFKGLSIAERLQKSLSLYEAANGEVKMPGNAKPADKPTKADPEESAPSTLSDIAGGSLPAKSEKEALDSMSAGALTNRMLNMDPKDIDKLLARLSL